MKEREWQLKSLLPRGAPDTQGSKMVSVNNSLLLVGGHQKICAQYAILSDTWTLLTQPSLYHNFGGVLLYDNRIYLLGGGSGNSPIADIEEYDIKSDTWTISSLKMPKGLKFFTAAMVLYL